MYRSEFYLQSRWQSDRIFQLNYICTHLWSLGLEKIYYWHFLTNYNFHFINVIKTKVKKPEPVQMCTNLPQGSFALAGRAGWFLGRGSCAWSCTRFHILGIDLKGKGEISLFWVRTNVKTLSFHYIHKTHIKQSPTESLP